MAKKILLSEGTEWPSRFHRPQRSKREKYWEFFLPWEFDPGMLPFQFAFQSGIDLGVSVVDYTWLREPEIGDPKVPIWKRLGKLLVVFAPKSAQRQSVVRRRPASKSCGKAASKKQAREKVRAPKKRVR